MYYTKDFLFTLRQHIRTSKERHLNIRTFVYLFTVLCIFITSVVNVFATPVMYDDNILTRYESVLIEEGDTLWAIADAYNNKALSGISTPDYINDIKEINQIKDDTITTGNYIIVPVYHN